MLKIKTFSRSAPLALLLVGLTAQAAPSDIHGKGDRYIRVTRSLDLNSISFESCPVAGGACKAIGAKTSDGKPALYRVSDLRDRASAENREFIAATIGEVAVGAILILGTGGIAGMATAATLDGASSIPITYGAMTIAGGGTVWVPSKIEGVSPFAQWRQKRVLGKDVLADESVALTASIDLLTKALESDLAKVKPVN